MNRREFVMSMIQASLMTAGLQTLAGCGKNNAAGESSISRLFSGRGEIIMYDTNAMALYFDGGLGPKTGVIKVDYILKNEKVTLPFWHGHNGVSHMFTLLPEHYEQFKTLKKIYLETTVVADHKHKLFVDFSDVRYRVPGAKGIPVPTLRLVNS